MNETHWIPLAECKNGFVYRISSRNLRIGVFNPETVGFTGIRTKFGDRYLFEEHHWDQGPPYGTAKPLKEIGPIPDDVDVFAYLDRLEAEYKG